MVFILKGGLLVVGSLGILTSIRSASSFLVSSGFGLGSKKKGSRERGTKRQS